MHIIESFLLQDTVRILFQNNDEEKRILDFVQEIEDIVSPLNPVLFYFHQEDAKRSIRRIWNRREEGVIKLSSDYQDFTNQLFKRYQ